MRVLVTGGTGFVGQAVVQSLLQAGHAVQVLGRSRRPLPPGVLFFKGSVLRPDTLPEAVAHCDAVVHLVGIIAEAPGQSYREVHVNGTTHTLQAAVHARVRRWLHMSALGTRPGAVARYHQTKWEAEEQVRQSALEWTLFRPSLIYGPGDGFVNLFDRIARWSPIVPLPGGGRSLIQPVRVTDVATCFTRALVRPQTIGGTYELVGPSPITLSELVDTLLEVTGRQRLRLPIPLPLARIPATLAEFLIPLLTRGAPPLNRDQLTMLAEPNTGDPGPMRQAFDVDPLPFRQGLQAWLSG